MISADSYRPFAPNGFDAPVTPMTGGQFQSAATEVTSSWRNLGLALRVQLDAFCFAPLAYVQAIGWRLCGLKVRSRNRFAALAGNSSHAYDLWIAREEPKLWSSSEPISPVTPKIVPVVNLDGKRRDVEATAQGLRSTGYSGPIIGFGTEKFAEIVNVDRTGDIAAHVGSGELWLCLLDAGDQLAPLALDEYARVAAQAGSSTVIYADDDLIDERGNRRAPHFKPDWNPELFEHHDFVTGSAIVRVGPETLSDLPSEQWANRLFATALGSADTPKHLQLVLHHRRKRPAPVIPAKPRDQIPHPAPLVTVIIPTRNQAELLRNCIDGLTATQYPSLELIVVDNGSDDAVALDYLQALKCRGTTVLRMPGPFNFSSLNNEAVEHAKGELICFLNNDVEMLETDWLELLVRQAIKPDIGAVGARLLYEDMTVQHAGVVTGIGGGAGHAHRFLRRHETGYFDRARLPQRVSAVTAACLVVAKEKFLAVGGFDEQDFPVAFNDVDLCLKLNERGWQSFYEPRATLIHHESKSRGSDATKSKRARFAGELAALKRKWRTDQVPDPYHHPSLSRFCEQFLIAV